MKKLIVLFCFILLVKFGFSQATVIGEIRIDNATTTFDVNLPVGTKVYDLNSGNYWVATTSVISTATLTTASASFQLINSDVPAFHATTHENGGGDEISVAGLSGVLADEQVTSSNLQKITVNGSVTTNSISTGGLVSSGQVTVNGNEVNISGTSPRIDFLESGATNNWNIIADGDNFFIRENGTANTRFQISSGGDLILPTGTVAHLDGVTSNESATVGQVTSLIGLDGLTNGYTPYMSTTLVDSPIFTDGTDVSIGGTDLSYQFQIENVISNSIMQLRSSNSSICGIYFGDTDLSARGRILYDHSLDALRFYETSAERMRLINGRLLIGTTTDNVVDRLQVNGSIISNGLTSTTGKFTTGASTNAIFTSDATGLGSWNQSINLTGTGLFVGDVTVASTSPHHVSDIIGTSTAAGLLIRDNGDNQVEFGFNKTNSEAYIFSDEPIDFKILLGNSELYRFTNNYEFQLTENVLTHGTVPSEKGNVFLKNDGKLYFKNDAQTEYDLTATGGGSGTVTSIGISGTDFNISGSPVTTSGTISMSIASGVVGSTELASNAVTNVKVADDAIGIAELSATGTASSSTYLRGDNIWATGTGATTPGGANGDIQYNNSGSFGGFGDWNGSTLTVGGNMTAVNVTASTGASINEFSIDGALAGNSDTAVPTEKAVKTYVDNNIPSVGVLGIKVVASGNIVLTSTDYTAIGITSSTDFLLPASSATGKIFRLVNNTNFGKTLRNSTDTADVLYKVSNTSSGTTTSTISFTEVVEIQYDGSQWWQINNVK